MSDPDEQQPPSLQYGQPGTTGFVKGSDTSLAHAGFESARAGTIQAEVLRLILLSRHIGRTSREIEDITGWRHQTVSATIRNLELDGWIENESWGKVVKKAAVRDGSHPYIAAGIAYSMHTSDQKRLLLEPTPRNATYKQRWERVMAELRQMVERECVTEQGIITLLLEYDSEASGDLMARDNPLF
jgi:hypothetical protein